MHAVPHCITQRLCSPSYYVAHTLKATTCRPCKGKGLAEHRAKPYHPNLTEFKPPCDRPVPKALQY